MIPQYLLLFFCFGSLFRTVDITIISASSEQWWGGKEPAGKGINYDIQIKVMRSSDQMQFDQLWIGDTKFEFILSDSISIGNLTCFKKNDVIHIIAAEKYYKNEAGEWVLKEEGQHVELPHKYEGAALIVYTVNNKRKYKEITSFTEREVKYLP